MEEAAELANYLPLSFKTPKEQEYIEFLWAAIRWYEQPTIRPAAARSLEMPPRASPVLPRRTRPAENFGTRRRYLINIMR